MVEESQRGQEARRAWINQIVGGRYEALEAIGESALLWVFRARDQQQNRIVALKLLRGDVPERELLEQRLMEGWGRALELHHPGIVRGWERFSDPERGLCGFTEEFVRGIDLAERIRRAAPFPLNVATDIAAGVAEALAYAHRHGVVHGDVSATHVLLAGEGSPKLTGFGQAGPEISAQDDVEQVGGLLQTMLTGEPPRREAEEWVSPKRLNQGVPRALEGITLKALQRGYADAEALQRDLEAVQRALQQGDSLSWSPLESVSAADAPTTIMPSLSAAKPAASPQRRSSRPATPQKSREPASEESTNVKSSRPRSGVGRWLFSFNMLLLLGIGILAWQLVSMIRTIMVPPGEVVVPDLIGKTLDEAETMGHKARFEVIEWEKKNQVNFPAGTIYMQREQKGMKVKEGQKINVGVSLGPVTVVVPGVTEMLLERAKKELDKAGLRLGTITYKFDFAPKGNVIEQDPDLGERRAKGAQINLVVSKGEEPTPEPTPEPTFEPTPEPIEAPPGGNSAPPPAAPDPALEEKSNVRTYSVPENPYQVPKDGRSHRIRIDVMDEDGKRTEYDAQHEAGEPVQASVTVKGKAVIRLYDNDVLKGEANQ